MITEKQGRFVLKEELTFSLCVLLTSGRAYGKCRPCWTTDCLSAWRCVQGSSRWARADRCSVAENKHKKSDFLHKHLSWQRLCFFCLLHKTSANISENFFQNFPKHLVLWSDVFYHTLSDLPNLSDTTWTLFKSHRYLLITLSIVLPAQSFYFNSKIVSCPGSLHLHSPSWSRGSRSLPSPSCRPSLSGRPRARSCCWSRSTAALRYDPPAGSRL